MRTNAKLEREVTGIGDLPRQNLVAVWTTAHGCPPPKGVNRPLLELSAAWHLQAKRLGGLSTTTKKMLRHHASGNGRAVSPRISAGKDASLIGGELRPPAALSSGARLMREWNGRVHAVDVTDGGFVFDGKTYRSLSAIARRITGVNWSGPRFFGL
jgi:hypothetical protein